ncbi:soma ferritin [Biomphalaria pfeifferi]|uniref:Ferritin n=1 Tax=Biomphalaria pfeifferi TaxID=112525 RepID=A0AAD8BEF8_BIOPF|nr:soma ferritin [Biomphalaria pfeifferi]
MMSCCVYVQTTSTLKAETLSHNVLSYLLSLLRSLFIKKPDRVECGTGLESMQAALQLSKRVNQSLLDLHKVCTDHETPLSPPPPQLADFLESEYLEEQVESIKQICDYITNLRHVGSGLGEYLFEKETLGSD